MLTGTKNGLFDVCNTMVAHPTLNKFYVGTDGGLYEFTEGVTAYKKINFLDKNSNE